MITKVYLTGQDGHGWALDQDFKQIKTLFQRMPEFQLVEDPAVCDCVYSVWWESLCQRPIEFLKNKFVVCSMSNRPFHELSSPQFSLLLNYIDKIVVQSSEAQREFESIGKRTFYLPYTISTEIFHPLPDTAINSLKAKYQLPHGKYLIGNFHRDSEGKDLYTPKLQKGPDILLEILRLVWSQHKQIHVLLAGPRRHWLRNRLQQVGIPYTFVGKLTANDDYEQETNILNLSQINELYQLLDLVVVSSRWEGAPRTILEAAATKTKVISSKVGIAEDILQPACLFENFLDAAQIIVKDLETDTLRPTVEQHYTTLLKQHTTTAVEMMFRQLCAEIGQEMKSPRSTNNNDRNDFFLRQIPQPPKTGLSIGMWHQFFQPPYGGGNQFMLALGNELEHRNYRIFNNTLHPTIDCYVLNAVHFDVKLFLHTTKRKQLAVVHRIDGPIQKYRGQNKELDDLCYRLNSKLASFTVVQSNYVLIENTKLGYTYINPVIIRNAVNPLIFNRTKKVPFSRNRKIRLISTSWSDNPRKGGDIYKWLDEHLDWDKYEYTFVGNVAETFQHIKRREPVPSEEVTRLLQQHDIYITASQYDPCSNALLEALACGLPAVYLKSGGHAELVGWGGLGFDNQEEIPELLETICSHYEGFQNLIAIKSITDVVNRYCQIFDLISLAPRERLRIRWQKFTRFIPSPVRRIGGMLIWHRRYLWDRIKDYGNKRFARDVGRWVGMWLAPNLTRKQPRVFYGYDHLPSLGEMANGGMIKCQRLQNYFPNTSRRFNLMYFVSSCLPHDWPQLLWIKCRKDIKLVWNQNGVGYAGWHGTGWEQFNEPMRQLLHAADYVIYQSRFAKLSADHFLGTYQGPWEILYNTVDTHVFTPAHHDPNHQKLVLLLGGSQFMYYRIESALRTLSILIRQRPDVHLLVTGKLCWIPDEVEAKQIVHQLIVDLDIAEHITLLGPYTQKDAPVLLRQAHILLHPQYNDVCPGLVIEAMACGLPVVYSQSGGVPELVGDTTGIGVPTELSWEQVNPPDPEKMAIAVLQVAERRKEFAEAARQRAVEHFDVRPWIQRHQEIFERVIQG